MWSKAEGHGCCSVLRETGARGGTAAKMLREVHSAARLLVTPPYGALEGRSERERGAEGRGVGAWKP